MWVRNLRRRVREAQHEPPTTSTGFELGAVAATGVERQVTSDGARLRANKARTWMSIMAAEIQPFAYA